MAPSLATVGVNVPAPAGAALVAALTAVTGGVAPVWYPAVTDGTGGRGRTCEVQIGGGSVQIFEVPLPAALPEQLTIRVDDPDAAITRLRAAGFDEVVEHPDLSLVASLNVAGVCIRIGAA
jgi:hypothetical protein